MPSKTQRKGGKKPQKIAESKDGGDFTQTTEQKVIESLTGYFAVATGKKIDDDKRVEAAKALAELADESPKALAQFDLFGKIKTNLETKGKGSAHLRQGSIIIVGEIATTNLPRFEYAVVALLGAIVSQAADKAKPVAVAAKKVVKQLKPAFSKNALKSVLSQLYAPTKGKASDVLRMKLIQYYCTKATRQMSRVLIDTIPAVCREVHNINAKVGEAAVATLAKLCACCENVDVKPLIPILLEALAEPKSVKMCVNKLAGTTFVEIIDSTALSIICPILVSGLRSKIVAVQRGCAKIADNLATLVEDPRDLAPFLPRVLPLLQDAAETIPTPEARKQCAKAVTTLKERSVQPAKTKMVSIEEVSPAFKALLSEKKISLTESQAAIVEYSIEILTMINESAGPLDEVTSSLMPYLECVTDSKKATAIVEAVKAKVYREIVVEEEEIDDGAELLCNCDFSLAFGNNVLLRKTRMILHRGKRYGLIGQNDCGKTSLMRAIADHRVEGFPPEDELRTIFVETEIPAELADLTVLNYILDDPDVKKLGLEAKGVSADLTKMGFKPGSPATQSQTVGTLSGGWRMKIALTRAMLLSADILLLDEPTNHLDSYNKAWVEDYLMSLPDVTSIFVSHDSTFLNKVGTNMIHIDKKRLHYYNGNLDFFVTKVPAAKAFFELKSDTIKFSFPNPGKLQGVTSKGKAVMKMTDISFTYPGVEKAQLTNVTVQIALGSRVACVGVNGAGKSTMIRLLTGELLPDKGSGKVWSHPNLRVGYIAQNAFHHIENHLTKTCNEYIRWRYCNGNDREETQKIANIVTPEEKKKMEKAVEFRRMDVVTGIERKVALKLEKLTEGRRTNKAMKDQEYQAKIKGSTESCWILRKILMKAGWEKMLIQVDQRIAMREGMFAVALTGANVAKHMAEVGLAEEFSTHNTIGSLSGGQKVKVVLGAALWNRPHVLILDEPTNYLDRESLGALAQAIREFEGGVVMITHSSQFCDNLSKTVWHLQNNTLDVKGDAEWMKEMKKKAVVEDAASASGEMIDKFGNTVKITRKEKLSNKEKKKRAKARAKRNRELRKQGLPEEETSSDSD